MMAWSHADELVTWTIGAGGRMPDEFKTESHEGTAAVEIARCALGVADPLAAAATRLLDRPVDDLGEVDLRDVIVVIPGRRAGRQLLIALDDAATAAGRLVVPPRTLTPSGLPALVAFNPDRPAADPETWLAAVSGAIDATSMTAYDSLGSESEEATRLLSPDADGLERRALARTVIEADRVVRAGGIDWDQVIEGVLTLGGDPSRHRAISASLQLAAARLAEHELASPEDAADAAITSLERNGPDPTLPPVREVVLLGLVDPSNRDRRLIRALAGAGVRVSIFSIIDPAGSAGLDDFGAVGPGAFGAEPPRPPIESIRVEAAPLDEASALDEELQAMARSMEPGNHAEHDEGDRPSLDPDDVAVVLADEQNGPGIRRELEARGISVHLATGRELSSAPIARSLDRVRGWCAGGDTRAFADLLADPAIGGSIRAGMMTGDPEASLTEWSAEHLPAMVRGTWWNWAKSPAHEATLAAADSVARMLLGPFHPGDSEDDISASRPLNEWVNELIGLLRRVDDEHEDGAWSDASTRAVRDALAAVMMIPAALTPMLDASEAMAVMVELVGRGSLPDPGAADSIETIGWLEAPFDPARRLLVTGLHDAAVPGRRDDPLLPDGLRSELGLEDDRRRTARDRWVLATILGRDPEARFLVSRHDALGEPLLPSRLLFGVADPPKRSSVATGSNDPDRAPVVPAAFAQDLARRVGHVFDSPARRRGGAAVSSAFGRFKPPEPGAMPLKPPSTMSATAFRDYLASPYRFWLRRILRLDAKAPMGEEFDPRLFGLVLHDAVEAFGRLEIGRLEEGRAPLLDVDAVHGEMLAGMEHSIRSRIVEEGSDRSVAWTHAASAALRLQGRILESRLRRVAEIQVERSEQGWRVHEVESEIKESLDVPGEAPQPIRGRIDRIDRHPERGWQLLDFKTSDQGKGPDAVHYRASTGDWLDLQLPLYRWAASSRLPGSPGPEEIQTGYFVVGGDPSKIKVLPSKKIDPLVDEAMDVAREIVRSIRAGYFVDPPGVKAPYEGDPVALVMRSMALVADGEEEGGE